MICYNKIFMLFYIWMDSFRKVNMENITYFIKEHWKFILPIFLAIFIILATIYYFFVKIDNKELQNEVTIAQTKSADLKNSEEQNEKLKVDIKGEVKFPGVYELETNCIVMDAITLAGGLTENATTENINLSYKLEEGMVIIIYSKDALLEENKVISEVGQVNGFDITSEVKKQKSLIVSTSTGTLNGNEKTDDQQELEQTDNNEPTIVNINTASKEELTTLSGIGDTKAEKIIAYRQANEHLKI